MPNNIPRITNIAYYCQDMTPREIDVYWNEAKKL